MSGTAAWSTTAETPLARPGQLRPGMLPARAGAVAGAPGRPAHRGRAAGLPARQFTSKVVPYPLSACASSGPVWLHASPVQN
jgi:hypothetical protein